MVAQAPGAATVEDVLAWHPHPDVWAVILVLAVGYWYAHRRLAPLYAPQPTPRRQWIQWYSGVAVWWIATDWPIHDLGESSMFTFHMLEHMLIALVAVPLLMIGMPRWLAKELAAPILPVLKQVARPVVAFVFFNLVFVGLHWPLVVEAMVTNEFAHFGVHLALALSAVVMWLPVLSPIPDLPRLSDPVRMLYLFGHSLLPTIPASFLTFGRTPIYTFYGDFPRLWDWSPLLDQTVAGILMKLGGGLILWTVIGVIFFRWHAAERRWDEIEAELRATPTEA